MVPMTDEPPRSRISDELDVPSEPPEPTDGSHILPLDELRYPTLTFEDGTVSPTTGIQVRTEQDRVGIQSLLRDIEAALASHDLCVEGPDNRVIFGIGPGAVSIEFDPDADQLGTLSIQIDLRAKALTYNDIHTPHVGARGSRGFIPRGMLTGEIDPADARCYNWIDDPTAHLDTEKSD